MCSGATGVISPYLLLLSPHATFHISHQHTGLFQPLPQLQGPDKQYITNLNLVYLIEASLLAHARIYTT
jgi:hypothetical protein